MLWTLDTGGFRQKTNNSQFKSDAEVYQTISFIASKVSLVSKIREMATINPEQRPTAAQMLVKYYNGVGLNTPRNQVPGLTS
jgi:hypothetical protein